MNRSDTLGYVAISLREIQSKGKVGGIYILHRHPAGCLHSHTSQQPVDAAKNRMAISIKIVFTPVDPEKPDCGLPLQTYFASQTNVPVKLYHSAHQIPGQLPDVPLENGKLFQSGSCWNDIATAIENAISFVLICGWAVSVDIRLRRTEDDGETPSLEHPTLGEMLKKKQMRAVLC